jgi:hypothetical protein
LTPTSKRAIFGGVEESPGRTSLLATMAEIVPGGLYSNSPKLTITQVYYSIVNEGEATRELRKNETEVYREVARQRSFRRPLLDIVVPFLSSRTRTASTVWEKDHETSLFHSARCDTIMILARARRLRQNGTTPMPCFS